MNNFAQPIILNVTGFSEGQPIILFPASGEIDDRIKLIYAPKEYNVFKEYSTLFSRLKLRDGDNWNINGMRIEMNSSILEARNGAIGFKRGDIQRKFILPYFVQPTQYMNTVVELRANISMDGKTEILLYGKEQDEIKLYLYINDILKASECFNVDYDRSFDGFVNNRIFYDDVIRLKNKTTEVQKVKLTVDSIKERSFISDNDKVEMESDYHKYKNGDLLQLFRTDCPTRNRNQLNAELLFDIKYKPWAEYKYGAEKHIPYYPALDMNSYQDGMREMLFPIKLEDASETTITLSMMPSEEMNMYFSINKLPFRTQYQFRQRKYDKTMFQQREDVGNEINNRKKEVMQLEKILADWE